MLGSAAGLRPTHPSVCGRQGTPPGVALLTGPGSDCRRGLVVLVPWASSPPSRSPLRAPEEGGERSGRPAPAAPRCPHCCAWPSAGPLGNTQADQLCTACPAPRQEQPQLVPPAGPLHRRAAPRLGVRVPAGEWHPGPPMSPARASTLLCVPSAQNTPTLHRDGLWEIRKGRMKKLNSVL